MLKATAATAILLLAALLASCEPPGVVRAAKPVLAEAPRTIPYQRATAEPTIGSDGCHLDLDGPAAEHASARTADHDLRGDEGFDPEQLSAPARCWYEQLWSALAEPRRAAHYTTVADSGDLYLYARTLNTHVNALLTAFRLTGDLLLLDEVDRLAQHMRSTLDDAWNGPAAFDRDGIDGYLNWTWRQSHPLHSGRDLHVTDEMRAHSLVAQIAWAFRANEDLSSPNGVDYRERADFWTSYLVEHFEAKWRQRNETRWPKFPFMSRPHTHETLEFVRYHHYLYLLTGKEEYRREAQRLSTLSFENFRVADSDSGEALVVTHSVIAAGGHEDYLLPSTYVRYVYSTAVDLFFEGVEPWSDPKLMERLARSLSEFMIDNGAEDFARDMGGGETRGGLKPSDASDWGRFGAERFNNSPYVLMAAWDDSGEVLSVSEQVYAGLAPAKRDVFIPVGELVALLLEPGVVSQGP